MVAKASEAKRRAFLRAFARCGNVTLSAGQAGLSRSWVSLTRRAEPEFDARCRAAKAASAARLAGGECNRPPPGWERRGEAPLVVNRSARRPPQVTRAPGRWRWTPRAEARFLGVLPATCNLRLASRQAGMTVSSLEAHLRRWPDFRRRVKAALAIGRVRLEARLEMEREAARERGYDFGDPEEVKIDMTVAEMIRMVRRRRRGDGRGG
jgi:hypothetical protein